jgi:small-conductance mechanosensitive channel
VLAEGLVVIAGGVMLLRAWGLDPFAPTPASGLARLLPGLVQAAVTVALGLALWRVAATLLQGAAPADEDGVPDEDADRSRTRLQTILPLLRSFLLVAIALVTAMTALSALGAEIAPLLAGAGVLGLAIGFGAQKLVADIISGLFYLYEDAFRLGEYIETSSGKGEVERITLRSVVLRHHRGPLYTIPFSEMGTIQNHSRDWVKNKFTFSIPSDTDLEMVRKTVKKVGQELEADPDLTGRFLEPLKSQGAIAINGPSFEIGCKFTTRPGDQFLVRRKIYAALQRAFQEKGISFFAPQLRVAPDGLAPHSAAEARTPERA